MASKAAVNTFLRVYGDPDGEQARGAFVGRNAQYRMLWHYYRNSAFEDLAAWQAYKARYRLYRHTRSIYNPTRRLVDFYAGTVYQGVLSTDARRLPDGTPLAIPFAEDTDAALLAAVGQLWRWSNWQIGKTLMVRYGAALGDCAVEVIDDLDARKVTMEVRWPGLIDDLDLDSSGNVKAYAMEYDYEDADATKHTYRKEVDSDWIRTFRDAKPHEYHGVPAERPNEYGFVPLVWIKHVDLGSDHGEPALRSIGKVDELNALASHAIDQAHKVFGAPLLVTGKNIGTLTESQTKRGATNTLANPAEGQESLNILRSDESGDIKSVNLPEGQALAYIESLLSEVERDHPEIGMYNQLREMSEVTAPGASRMFGDVAAYVDEARAIYDTQSVKLFQMATAIAGWRVQRGDWGNLDRQREAFQGFGLDSYFQGDLDMEILPRPLIPLSRREVLELERMELAIENDRQNAQAGAAGIRERLAAEQGA